MKVGDIAAGRAGDKGAALDLSLVARNERDYQLLVTHLTQARVAGAFREVVPGPVLVHRLPALRALKIVLPEALGGGVHASMRAGMHWQKAAIWILLDLELPTGDPSHG